MKIYSNRIYLLSFTLGISGFQKWEEKEFKLMMGQKVKQNFRANVINEYPKGFHQKFRLDNGKLPEFQPITDELGAIKYLQENIWSSVTLI